MDEAENNPALSMLCPAKLNLTLAVGPPRADGLHPIASVMAALDFGDTLDLEHRSEHASTFKRSWAADAPKPGPIDWPIESDLIFRAHAMMEAEAGRRLPVNCILNKRIPAGAGLGGGSSNAAGMLVGLRRLFELDVPDERLVAIGSTLGADVAFAVHALLGQPAALVTGVGDRIEPLHSPPGFNAVLAFPDGVCPTAAVYQAFDQLHADNADIPDELIKSWRRADTIPAPRNDLTAAAIHVCPEISHTIDAIKSQNLEPRLTGSGSAVFTLVGSQQQAVAIAKAFKNKGVPASSADYVAAI